MSETILYKSDAEIKRVVYLDGWRGMAIGFVLISHFLTIPGINLGRLGVDIFFVLSGLLMGKILFVERVKLTIFYKRRVSRIFPVFFIYLSLVCLCSWLFNLSAEHNNFFYLLFFLRSYFPVSPDIWHTGLPLGHLWSLNVEEHCYVILSIVAVWRFVKGKEYILLLLLGVSSILLHCLYVKFPELASHNYELKTEIVVSHLLLSSGYFLIKDKFSRFIFPLLPVATFLTGIFCYSDYAPWYSSWLISPFLLAFTVNHLDLLPKAFIKILSYKPMQMLGIWSYSIYLWQQPFYYYGVKYSQDPFPFSGILFVTISIIIGILSFYVIEKPIRQYLNGKSVFLTVSSAFENKLQCLKKFNEIFKRAV